MSHVYRVAIEDRNIMYVEADSKHQARATALGGVTVDRIDSGEVIRLTRRGIAIVSAATGKVCNGDDAATAAEELED